MYLLRFLEEKMGPEENERSGSIRVSAIGVQSTEAPSPWVDEWLCGWVYHKKQKISTLREASKKGLVKAVQPTWPI